ncbi:MULTISPECIES: NUDIX hydrolase [Sphingobacterium]|uniref:NUDIX hydrolase n=1 Tax=Sphingobacterium TaxID=28453 RepID=UPI0013D92C69|nr:MULTISPECIES: NUDIX domain-containing protein [unclassified Sphingobacterium]
MHRTITVALAIVIDQKGDLLALRKKSAPYFTLPGGKIASGETPLQALTRELKEELNLTLTAANFEFLGMHKTIAANEANTSVEGHIFLLRTSISQTLYPYNEIEEIAWLSKLNYKNYKLAHLLTEFALPKWLNGLFY